jgi:hypothetical protein
LTAISRGNGKVVQFHAHGSALAKSEEDQRRAPRRRVLKSGTVAYNERHTTLPCSVRDISTTGARVQVEGSICAPDTFDLLIPLDGLEASCEVVWRNGQEVGVRFITAPRMVAPKRVQVINALVPQQRPSLRRKPKPGETV